jgi:hypothetical protein
LANYSNKEPAPPARPSSNPEARIAVINLSLRAFICGLFSILPIIGLLPAIAALASWARIHLRYRNEWNPADSYLGWGTALAVLGIGITAVGIPALILSIAISNAQSGY